ncbi:MAG: glycosyltransferase family 2 protein [Anaerolineae bacterium]|nr:glycosyltransferase family 2 protein [Anaerolineae bacterium]
MKLSIIICVYNERDTILTVLERVRAAHLGEEWEKEIIVVDNFSTDGTRELLQELNAPDIKVIFHPRNLGKGSSVRTGIAHCTGDYAIIQDADLEYDPQDYTLFLERVAEDHPAAIYGSRTLGGRAIYKYVANYWGVRFLTALTNLLYGAQLTDVATAAKMVRTDVLKSLHLSGTGFDLDFELTDKLLRAGYHIAEVPISYRPRTIAEGKKIRPWDGLWALKVILRDRLLPMKYVVREKGAEGS